MTKDPVLQRKIRRAGQTIRVLEICKRAMESGGWSVSSTSTPSYSPSWSGVSVPSPSQFFYFDPIIDLSGDDSNEEDSN